MIGSGGVAYRRYRHEARYGATSPAFALSLAFFFNFSSPRQPQVTTTEISVSFVVDRWNYPTIGA